MTRLLVTERKHVSNMTLHAAYAASSTVTTPCTEYPPGPAPTGDVLCPWEHQLLPGLMLPMQARLESAQHNINAHANPRCADWLGGLELKERRINGRLELQHRTCLPGSRDNHICGCSAMQPSNTS